ARCGSAPASAGVTLGARISASASVSGSIVAATLVIVAQQFVDRGLATRLLVDALDDDAAGERRAGRAVGQFPAGQAAGHHHRVGWHAAEEGLAGGAVDNLGRSADKTPHGEDGALFDNHAFRDFAARANEAIVLDDDRRRLHRFQHAADADAARDVTVLADLGAGADRRPG